MTGVTEPTTPTCSCCGEARPAADVAHLHCTPDVVVCRSCVGWLAARVQAPPTVTPIFPVRDMDEAQEFWTRTGFEVERYDDGYAFVLAGAAEVVNLALVAGLDPERNAAACYAHVDDPAVWHERWAAEGLPVSDLRDEPWGMREFSVRDPSGNLVRVGANS